MPEILQLRGPRAVSDFRLTKLVAQLQKVDPGIRAVGAEYRHFVELDRDLARPERTILERPPLPGGAAPGHAVALVVEGHRYRA